MEWDTERRTSEVFRIAAFGQIFIWTTNWIDTKFNFYACIHVTTATYKGKHPMNIRTFSVKKITLLILIICIILSAAPISVEAALLSDARYLTLSPGADDTQINFSWHSQSRAENDAPCVRVWKNEGIQAVFTGIGSNSKSTVSNMYYNRVTATGLDPDAAYSYQIGDGNGNWSVEYSFKTGNPDSFSYLVFGDPQVYSRNTGNNWKNTLELAVGLYPNLSFMASTGDNVDANTKTQYDSFFTPQELFSALPLAICMGNHEGSGSTPFAFYNPPNADSLQSYWYRYGAVLFMVWNSNSGRAGNLDEFLEKATQANGDATWRILNFHHVLYGQGVYTLSDGVGLRAKYAPVIEKYDIDVVFNGHDHSYSRSNPVNGTVYFTLNSASGSKYYALSPLQSYTAVMDQSRRPNFSVAEVSGDSFKCTTYKVNADNTLTEIDTTTITKPTATPSVDHDEKDTEPAGLDTNLRARRCLFLYRAYMMRYGNFPYKTIIPQIQGQFPYYGGNS